MTQWTPGKPKPWEGARQCGARAMGAAVTSLTLLLAELLVGEVSSLVSVLVALRVPHLSENLNADERGAASTHNVDTGLVAGSLDALVKPVLALTALLRSRLLHLGVMARAHLVVHASLGLHGHGGCMCD